MIPRITSSIQNQYRQIAVNGFWRGIGFLVCGLLVGVVVLILPGIPKSWGLIILLSIAGFSGLLVIGNLQKVLITLIIIDIPLRWDIYLGARIQDVSMGNREGWIISLTTIALTLLFALYFLRLLVDPQKLPKLLIFENLPLVLYLMFCLLSIVVSKDKVGSIFQLFFLGQMFFLYLYFSSMVTTINDILFIVCIFLIGLTTEGIISIAQRFIGLSFNFAGIMTVNDFGRLAGTLGSPNVAAGFFSLFLAPAFALIFQKKYIWLRLLALFAFVVGSAGLFFTISRGGWIAYALSLAIIVFAFWLRGSIPPWMASIILIIFLTGVILFGSAFFARFISVRENAALSRITLMQIAWKMILEHPIFGVGLNNYVFYIYQYAVPTAASQFLYVVHNKYLLIWAEIGFGGLVAYLGYLFLSIQRGWKAWARNYGLISLISLGMIAGVIGQMSHMMVEIFDARSEVQALWLFAALITATYQITQRGIDG